MPSLSLKVCEQREDKVSMTYRSFVKAPPNEFVFPTGRVTPLSAKFDLFFSIPNSIHVVTMQLPEAFDNNMLGSFLDLMTVIPHLILELYN